MTSCLARISTNLDDLEQDVVEQEPEQEVDEEEGERAPGEERADGPGHEEAEDHTLPHGLQDDEKREHRGAELHPPSRHGGYM